MGGTIEKATNAPKKSKPRGLLTVRYESSAQSFSGCLHYIEPSTQF